MGKQQFKPRFETVLLIDDDDIDNFINEKIITSALFANGVIVKNSAQAGLDFLKENINNLPEFIFLDLNVKGMNGFDFLVEFDKLVIENPIYKDRCKILVLSSSISEEEIHKASINPYVVKYLNKPLTENYLDAISI